MDSVSSSWCQHLNMELYQMMMEDVLCDTKIVTADSYCLKAHSSVLGEEHYLGTSHTQGHTCF